jgi:WD40 repeat protein
MDKEMLIPLMVSQLKAYGLHTVARSLQDEISQIAEPSDRLAEMCASLAPKPKVSFQSLGIYSNWFTTQHRGACTAAAFSPDGKYLYLNKSLIATGSEDTSLKYYLLYQGFLIVIRLYYNIPKPLRKRKLLRLCMIILLKSTKLCSTQMAQ